ncbi:MAG: DUF2249 domain-containing protein [Bacteroidales bacterium]|nr:DUF2249 domain-containing protein [Bacteroidales bacterium]
MKINANTRISALIDENEGVIDVISSINRHFRKLRNPVLRKMLAPRVRIADAAKIGGVPVCVMIDKLRDFGFEVEEECICDNELEPEIFKHTNTEKSMKKASIIDLDVRPILAGGTDPFEAIMAILKTLNDDETLRIINTFEPIPLLNILKKKGYEYQTERPEAGVVHTFLEKSAAAPKETQGETNQEAELTYDFALEKFAGKMKEIDVRDLEMPMPMVTILEELEKLNEEEALFVNHKKLPQYLLPELKDRAYKWVSKEMGEGDLKLIIFKLCKRD